MKREANEELKGQNITTLSRNRRVIIAALLLVVVTGAAGLWLLRGTNRSNLAGRPVPTPDFDRAPSPTGGAAPRPDDLLIKLQPEKLENAHLKIEAAVMQPVASTVAVSLRTTGTVEPNAYKVVPVMPIAGGIVRQVGFELGDKVERGQKLATIFSTELAEAQTAYLGLLAEIERHHQRYKRAAQLVEIGAVSREEFEEVDASYKIEQAKLTAARQKLLLLGMSAKQADDLNHSNQMSALIPVESPASGTVLSRTVNAGEVVTMGKELFRIADLSTVWVIVQIYEKDFANVRVGTPSVITAPAYPRSAVQMLGAKQVTFVSTNQPGVFAQREVSAGPESNGAVPIYAGLNAGEQVVTEGSFLLRAESLKLDPSQLTASRNQPDAAPQPEAQQTPANQAKAKSSQLLRSGQGQVQSVTVTLSDKGYQPDTFKLQRGIPARVTFVRKVEATCGTEVVLADYNINRELPLNQPVVVEFTPAKAGEFKFACGMDMLRGKIIVQ